VPRIYIETSVISYLANRPSRDGLVAARQALTHDWWAGLDKSEACLSALVVEEISRGDGGAAQKRLAIAEGLIQIEQTPEATALALRLIEVGLVPRTEPEDALHIALATAHRCRFLVSWNFAHFVGFGPRYRLMEQLKAWGYAPTYLVTPEEIRFGEPL
jgi:predicted nucleic acid-binding protein